MLREIFDIQEGDEASLKTIHQLSIPGLRSDKRQENYLITYLEHGSGKERQLMPR